MADFLTRYANSWNPDGPLTRRGMIAAPDAVRSASRATVAQSTPLDPTTLH